MENNSNETEQNNSISSDLIRGHINTIILRTLLDGEKYGLEIINDIETKSNGKYTIKQPTLYSALKRLEEKGYISSYTTDSAIGGKRKYFSLTDLGKKTTENEQSEWAYSRTVIDNLVSDKVVDIKNETPAVNKVDIKNEATAVNKSDNKNINEPIRNNVDKNIDQTINNANAYNGQLQKELEEQRKINEKIHENFLLLTKGELKKSDSKTENEPIFTEKSTQLDNSVVDKNISDNQIHRQQEIAYVNKSPAERNYKNLLSRLFENTTKSEIKPENNVSENKTFEKVIVEEPQTPIVVKTNSKIEFFDVLEKAEYDGLKVTTSNGYSENKKITTYNKGKKLFLSSVIIAILAILEIACILTLNKYLTYNLNYIYIAYGVVLGVVLIFGFLYLCGYGKNTVKAQKQSCASICLLINFLLILLIFALAILFEIKLVKFINILKFIIIPIILSFNITIFAGVFSAITKKI